MTTVTPPATKLRSPSNASPIFIFFLQFDVNVSLVPALHTSDVVVSYSIHFMVQFIQSSVYDNSNRVDAELLLFSNEWRWISIHWIFLSIRYSNFLNLNYCFFHVLPRLLPLVPFFFAGWLVTIRHSS